MCYHNDMDESELLFRTDLFGTKEAADYLGIAPGTLRAWVHKGRVNPIILSWRDTPGGGRAPYGLVFTRRQLQELKKGHPIVALQKHEVEQVFSTATAAEFLGVSESAIRQAYHVRETLEGVNVGSNVAFTLADLVDYRDRERGRKRTFSPEQVLLMRRLYHEGKTVPEIKHLMNIQLSHATIYSIVDGRIYEDVPVKP